MAVKLIATIFQRLTKLAGVVNVLEALPLEKVSSGGKKTEKKPSGKPACNQNTLWPIVSRVAINIEN